MSFYRQGPDGKTRWSRHQRLFSSRRLDLGYRTRTLNSHLSQHASAHAPALRRLGTCLKVAIVPLVVVSMMTEGSTRLGWILGLFLGVAAAFVLWQATVSGHMGRAWVVARGAGTRFGAWAEEVRAEADRQSHWREQARERLRQQQEKLRQQRDRVDPRVPAQARGRPAASRYTPPAPPISTPYEAELFAADCMRLHLRYTNVAATPPGPDSGVDVWSREAVAQVKFTQQPVGRPAVQNIFGIAVSEHREPLFFSLAGYTRQAQEWATQHGVALFGFTRDRTWNPITPHAQALLDRVRQPGR